MVLELEFRLEPVLMIPDRLKTELERGPGSFDVRSLCGERYAQQWFGPSRLLANRCISQSVVWMEVRSPRVDIDERRANVLAAEAAMPTAALR